jgi:non-ribosomal peptide synthetase component F
MDQYFQKVGDLYGRKVVSGASRFTYAQFGERCERLAAGLMAEGIRPGDRVAYLSFNNNALLEGYYGVVLARAVVMPLNVRLTPAELVAILNHSEARMLIFENDFAPLVEHIRKACPGIARYVTIDGAGPLADFTYEELLARGRMERPDVFSFDENAIAELFYTSGSTGTPEGRDAVAPHALPARPGRGRHLQSRRYGRGTAHHPAVPRQRMGPAAGFHHDGDQAGDGAAVRAHAGLPADSGGEGHRHVAGADHGQRAAERAGYGTSSISPA